MSDITNSKPAPVSERSGVVWAVASTALVSAASIWFFYSAGSILYFGDAESHLNIARRMVDSRTPGYDQLGSVWLPLPHIFMLPFVGGMKLWQTGLAGSISSGGCFVIAAGFLYAATARAFSSRAAAATATALFVLNPNALYLQSIPMTEAVFFAALLGVLYFTVSFMRSPSLKAAAGAGSMALAGTLTRYEGWFLLPFVALFLVLTGRRFAPVFLFCSIACIGPLWWFAHNWWLTGNALWFYNGPYSAKAIQGATPYPGKSDWAAAARYLLTASKLVAGAPLFWMGIAGAAVACAKRVFWPVLLLALPPLFYVWSMYSSGNPIYVPVLPPFSWYNTRYGLAALPLLAFSCGAITSLLPRRIGPAPLILLALMPWALHPHMANWVTWKESEVNSASRRQWTHEAAALFRDRLRTGDSIFTGFSDVTGIYREAGIPLRRTLTWDNGPYWAAAVSRPEFFLRERWAVSIRGDEVESAVARAPHFKLTREINVPGASPLRIYRQ